MTKLKFIDQPKFIPITNYKVLTEKLASKLLSFNSVLSVYQMGSVKDPGISDLDIICVFKNGCSCEEDVRINLNHHEKNILTHGLFGIEEQDFFKSISNNLLSNLNFLGGKDLKTAEYIYSINPEIKTQIALEYLVKMHITIDAQLTLKIVKLRAFLLLAKAILFDLELLNIKEGVLYDLVKKVFEYRANWFADKPSAKDMELLIFQFHKALNDFLENELTEKEFYLPKTEINLPGNFTIVKNELFSVMHKGTVLPNQFSFLGRKYINIQNRLNTFTYNIPFKIPEAESVINQRFQFAEILVKKNQQQFPFFMPLTTSLSIY